MAAEYQGRRDRVVETTARDPGRRAARARGGTVRDGRCPRTGEAVGRRFGGSCCSEAGVVVLHGAAYGPGGEGFLRVSFAAGGETLERGLERLRDGLMRLAAEGHRR